MVKRYNRVWVRHHDHRGQSVGRFQVTDRAMKLEIGAGRLRFFIEKDKAILTEVTELTEVTAVALKAVGSRMNLWVRVSHGQHVWYLANGALFGWGGILGGTKRLAHDIAEAFGLEVNANAHKAGNHQ